MAALSEIEKLEARWAENPDGRYFAPLADAYRKAGRVDDAIQVVTHGLSKHPDYLSAHIVLGRCHLEKKDDAGARGVFERVLGLDSENIIALKSLAEISERTGEPDAARKWLGRLLAVDAMNAEAAEDLERLGGPLEEAAGAGAPAESAEPVGMSFMDLSDEPAPAAAAPTVPTPALEEPYVPRTLERKAVRLEPPAPPPPPAPEPEPVKMLDMEPTRGSASPEPAAPLELESTSFQPPSADIPPIADPDLVLEERPAWDAPTPPPPSREPRVSAIEFMGLDQPPGRSAEAEPPMAGAPGVDPNMSTLPMDSVPPPKGFGGEPQAATIEMPPIRVPEAPPAPPEPQASEPEPAAADLHLIMPEDVTPADEMRRPSSKLVQMVSPEPQDGGADASGETMVTETMGDLYLRQGFKDQAADVYRRLLAVRPDDAGLKAKLQSVVSPQAMSAAALGTEAVGVWLRRIAKAQLGTPAPTPPAPPEPGPTPMEQAFEASAAEPPPEPQPVPVVESPEPQSGAPARPATDQYSLDQIFGGKQSPGGNASAPPPQGHSLGASFDEFFGSAPKQDTVRPKEGPAGGRQSEDDLSAFNAWLHGLKR